MSHIDLEISREEYLQELRSKMKFLLPLQAFNIIVILVAFLKEPNIYIILFFFCIFLALMFAPFYWKRMHANYIGSYIKVDENQIEYFYKRAKQIYKFSELKYLRAPSEKEFGRVGLKYLVLKFESGKLNIHHGFPKFEQVLKLVTKMVTKSVNFEKVKVVGKL